MLGDQILKFEKFEVGWFILVCFVAVLVVVFCILPVVFFFKDNPYNRFTRRIRFFFTFGIWPEKRRFSETWRKIVQKIIDSKIVNLANDYSFQDKNERYYNQQLQDLKVEKDEQKVIKEYLKWEKLLVKQKDKLNKAKKEFWKAWKLASLYGYKVKEKYTDYLPSAENQKS